MQAIHFESTLLKADPSDKVASGILLTLPKSASTQLPTRGMTLVQGTINGSPFKAVLEPDGQGSHWFKFNDDLKKATGAKIGDTVTLDIHPSKDWPEPKVPADLEKALAADPAVQVVWKDITPMARWDWIRWIGATQNPATRQRRIEVACSKMRSGMRRACCFDRSQCTLTDA